MAGTRGYNNYRGRRSKWKAVVAALLVLVILAAVVAVLLLQRHIVYDETGTPRLELFWKEETEPRETPQLDLVVQTPAVPALHGVRLTETPLTAEGWQEALASLDPARDAAAVVLKDRSGAVYFDSAAAVRGSVKADGDTAETLAVLTGGSLRTVAELSCLHDPKAAHGDVEGMGLKNTGGFLFYDGNNSQWLDPAKPAARQYVCALAVEAAALGFDELLLTDLCYPTEGRLEKIAYGDGERSEPLKLLLEELQAALEPYDILLAVEVTAETLLSGEDPVSGQRLSDVAAAADRICVRTAGADLSALAAGLEALEGEMDLLPLVTAEEPLPSGNYLIV